MVKVDSKLTFNNLVVPEGDNYRNTFVSTVEGVIQGVVVDNLGPEAGTVYVTVTTIDGIIIDSNTLTPKMSVVLRRLSITSVVTFGIQQTLGTSGSVDMAQLQGELAEALDLDNAKEALETEDLQAQYGEFTLGKAETDTGWGTPPFVETTVRSDGCPVSLWLVPSVFVETDCIQL